jgi:hypothetical protein
MNEHLFIHRVRQALDETADRLPYRVSQRLETARHEAIARALGARQPALEAATAVPARALMLGAGARPPLLLRLLSTVAPVLLMVAGLYGISVWDDAQRMAETADVDTELLLADDDIPIAAYADRGFGVYIKNVRQ